MIVVVIIGILAAIAIPNFLALQTRAREGGTKSNMHSVQLAAEDYGVQNDGVYAATMAVGTTAGTFQLPSSFKNAFSGLATQGNAWENRANNISPPTALVSGIVSYADSSTSSYNVKAYGRSTATQLSLVLTSGQ